MFIHVDGNTEKNRHRDAHELNERRLIMNRKSKDSEFTWRSLELDGISWNYIFLVLFITSMDLFSFLSLLTSSHVLILNIVHTFPKKQNKERTEISEQTT